MVICINSSCYRGLKVPATWPFVAPGNIRLSLFGSTGRRALNCFAALKAYFNVSRCLASSSVMAKLLSTVWQLMPSWSNYSSLPGLSISHGTIAFTVGQLVPSWVESFPVALPLIPTLSSSCTMSITGSGPRVGHVVLKTSICFQSPGQPSRHGQSCSTVWQLTPSWINHFSLPGHSASRITIASTVCRLMPSGLNISRRPAGLSVVEQVLSTARSACRRGVKLSVLQHGHSLCHGHCSPLSGSCAVVD